jgi:hypothetical protein
MDQMYIWDVRNVGQAGMPKEFKINIAMQRFGRGWTRWQKALGIFFKKAKWFGERLLPLKLHFSQSRTSL